jgi:hypothetical protein
VELLLELLTLMAVMDELDGLFEADGEEQAKADGAHVDEKVFPGVDGFVRRVDVDHVGPIRKVVRL